MGQTTALNDREIQTQVTNLPQWTVQGGKLHADFRFSDFVTAFAFMTKVAFAAEAAQHHPEWRNVYNQVSIDLVTHDAGNAISQKDIDLAHRINELAE